MYSADVFTYDLIHIWSIYTCEILNVGSGQVRSSPGRVQGRGAKKETSTELVLLTKKNYKSTFQHYRESDLNIDPEWRKDESIIYLIVLVVCRLECLVYLESLRNLICWLSFYLIKINAIDSKLWLFREGKILSLVISCWRDL